MAGVGNDVTYLGTAPHWKHDLIAPLFEPACIEETSFRYNIQVALFGQSRGLLLVRIACVESKNRRLSKRIKLF